MRHIAQTSIFVLTLLAFGLFALQAAARTRAAPGALFVATTGSDSGNDCRSPGTPCATLQRAHDLATTGDQIWVAGGTYTGSGAALITITKSITLYGGWDGQATVVPMRNPAAYPTTLDGESQHQVVYISGDVAPVVDGFIITKGKGGAYGAGISVDGASPIIRGNLISGNTAEAGGGILVNRGSAQLLYNRVVSNTATWGAGIQIINDAAVTVTGNAITNNTAATYAGGIDVECCGGATAFIAKNLIADNNGGNSGGGVRVDSTRVRLVNNILAHNQASAGASLFVQGTSSHPASAEVYNNTLVGSSPGSEALRVQTYVTATIVNTILASHTTGIVSTSPGTSLIAADYNLFWDTTDLLTGTNAVLSDPLLDADYHLRPASPAIDAGTTVAGVTDDIDGDPRPVGKAYDIGADEYALHNYLPLLTK